MISGMRRRVNESKRVPDNNKKSTIDIDEFQTQIIKNGKRFVFSNEFVKYHPEIIKQLTK
jgi:hypothetical protein